jgi:hypothetical protein
VRVPDASTDSPVRPDLPAGELTPEGRPAPREAATERGARGLARLRLAVSLLVALTAVAVLGSYALGWDRVASLSPDWAAMKPLTAACLLLLSLCGWLPRHPATAAPVEMSKRTTRSCGVVPGGPAM